MSVQKEGVGGGAAPFQPKLSVKYCDRAGGWLDLYTLVLKNVLQEVCHGCSSHCYFVYLQRPKFHLFSRLISV